MSLRLEPVQAVLQRQVDSGRLPGFVAAVRHRGETEVLTGGSTAVDGTAPMRPDTLFRLASVTKPFAGALALALVEDGVLGLDDPVERWLPELASPRVLRNRSGPLSDTVPAERPITVRHLLTNTPGFGGLWDGSPLDRAVEERQIAPGPWPPPVEPDEYLRRLAELPLAAQPGQLWLYHMASDVLGVLLSRATGRSVTDLLAERVTGPLGLLDTAFWTSDPDRLATCYRPTDAGLEMLDAPGGFGRPPRFESLAAGLVSTAPEVLAFLAALAGGGSPVLAAGAVAAMTADALTAAQRAAAAAFLGPGVSWGLQVGVCVEAARPWATPGRWGWDGGTGTSAWADPGRDLVAVLLTQRLWSGPDDEPVEFWRTLTACL